jgi:hypothetical protein
MRPTLCTKKKNLKKDMCDRDSDEPMEFYLLLLFVHVRDARRN